MNGGCEGQEMSKLGSHNDKPNAINPNETQLRFLSSLLNQSPLKLNRLYRVEAERTIPCVLAGSGSEWPYEPPTEDASAGSRQESSLGSCRDKGNRGNEYGCGARVE